MTARPTEEGCPTRPLRRRSQRLRPRRPLRRCHPRRPTRPCRPRPRLPTHPCHLRRPTHPCHSLPRQPTRPSHPLPRQPTHPCRLPPHQPTHPCRLPPHQPTRPCHPPPTPTVQAGSGDAVLTSCMASPENPRSGDTVLLSARVENVSAGDTRADLYVGFSFNDARTGNVRTKPEFVAKGGSATFTATADAGGNYLPVGTNTVECYLIWPDNGRNHDMDRTGPGRRLPNATVNVMPTPPDTPTPPAARTPRSGHTDTDGDSYACSAHADAAISTCGCGGYHRTAERTGGYSWNFEV